MERAVAVLPGDDLVTLKKFYVDGLGFSVTWEVTEDGKNGMMGVARGGMAVTLDVPMDGHGRNACVTLEVESADAYYEEWRNKVEIKRPPKNEEWGARTFSVTDPSGNTIFVLQPL